ncbi:MAG TPA: efflux RND transporter periplasmic adaptor subunit [Candidatus Paceibacterota bacterium]|nr:efflux RND transporter periplasmic adaptor subunit [Candidatus Paceibacterota bacterium]
MLGLFRHVWSAVSAFFRRLGLKKSLIGAGVLLVILAGSLAFLRGSAPVAAPDTATPSVTVATVAELSQSGTSLTVAGTVESQSEATVRAQKSGEITTVYHSLGDSVAAGAVIAEFEDSSERAAVLQAQGAVDAATAAAATSQTGLAGAKASMVTTLLSAYAAVDNAVPGGIDAMFSNPTSNAPILSAQSTNSQARVDAQNDRVSLDAALAREQGRTSTLSVNDDLAAEAATTESELTSVRNFLDTLIVALNAGIATQNTSQSAIDSYKAIATGARASINASLSTIIGAAQALQVSTQSSATGNGAISASQAALTQAQGALAAARAQLEKAIIRAPISGTINSLDLTQGDYVNAAQAVVTIANNHALKIVAYVTQDDAQNLSVGSKAAIEGAASGVVTQIAPAVDPTTKKIEVDIGITDNTGLVNGQSVSVQFTSSAHPATAAPTRLMIPLTALKITADGMNVFTVSASNTLEAHAVTIGELLGDRVVIAQGVTPDMVIVTDARGLRDGQEVTVRQ